MATRQRRSNASEENYRGRQQRSYGDSYNRYENEQDDNYSDRDGYARTGSRYDQYDEEDFEDDEYDERDESARNYRNAGRHQYDDDFDPRETNYGGHEDFDRGHDYGERRSGRRDVNWDREDQGHDDWSRNRSDRNMSYGYDEDQFSGRQGQRGGSRMGNQRYSSGMDMNANRGRYDQTAGTNRRTASYEDDNGSGSQGTARNMRSSSYERGEWADTHGRGSSGSGHDDYGTQGNGNRRRTSSSYGNENRNRLQGERGNRGTSSGNSSRSNERGNTRRRSGYDDSGRYY